MRQAKRRTILAALLTALVAAGCEELTSFEEDAGDGGGGESNAGGGPPAVYVGTYQNEVRHLLSRVSGWRTSRDAQTDGGVPPNVSMGPGCIRDTYVAAAVQYAWAAESYYRLGSSNAGSMAANMRAQLNSANELCSNVSGGGFNNCVTLSLWGCPPPY